ncbi:MAG: hypothetical protein ACYDBQ_12260 [Thermoplasmatota archaeon]
MNARLLGGLAAVSLLLIAFTVPTDARQPGGRGCRGDPSCQPAGLGQGMAARCAENSTAPRGCMMGRVDRFEQGRRTVVALERALRSFDRQQTRLVAREKVLQGELNHTTDANRTAVLQHQLKIVQDRLAVVDARIKLIDDRLAAVKAHVQAFMGRLHRARGNETAESSSPPESSAAAPSTFSASPSA